MTRLIICGVFLLSFANSLTAAVSDMTVEQFCKEYHTRVIKLLAALNLDYPGLEKVKEAASKSNWPQACDALLEYYKNADTAKWLRKPHKSADKTVIAKADRLADGYFEALSFEGKIPRLAGGHKDWQWYGPNNELEYNAALIRHTYMKDLLAAYLGTNDVKYVRCIDGDLTDWVLSAQMPNQREYSPIWGAGLECSLRLQNWSAVFFALQEVKAFTPVVRLLMLSAIQDQSTFIVNLGSFRANHVVAEMYGLALTGLCYPEFKDASGWVTYASNRMIAESTKMIYPDGVQKELSSHYHVVSLAIFSQYNDLLKTAGEAHLSELEAVCIKMADYLAYAMNPAGRLPLNGDSLFESHRQSLLEKAAQYHRPDWFYIASNGRQGKKPEGTLSVVYPWARQVFMRDGWDANSQYAFFDCGAWGIAHQHYDKLNMEIFAYGRDLLVDSGLYTYQGYRGTDKWRRYFIGSPSHNVILIDGVGQGTMATEYNEPMPAADYHVAADYDYAAGTFTDGFKGVGNTEPIPGRAVHTRKVLYLRGKVWIVVDQISTDRPRKIQALWHFHPDCAVEIQNLSVASIDPNKGNLRITPVSNLKWDVKLVKGQTEPNIQGWYSTGFNKKFSNYTAIYSADISSSTIFAWVLQPYDGLVPHVNAKVLSADDEQISLQINLFQSKPLKVSFPKSGTASVEPCD